VLTVERENVGSLPERSDGMKKITVAKSAGFCFGVDRAVNMCRELLDVGRSIATLGEIIHNTYVVQELAARGGRVVDTPGDAGLETVLVIRSHGVPQSVYDECERSGIETVDATCPFVSKIHSIVKEHSEKGYTVLIAGDSGHPEVKGIVGHCSGDVFIFEDIAQLRELPKSDIRDKPCIVVAQTTYNLSNYAECVEYIKKIYTNASIFDTICNATRDRQNEAEQLAHTNDVCIVIGGQNSSNTNKLYDLCSKITRTYRVENKDELSQDMLAGAETIGVTAGASTPSPIIREVLVKMDDIIRYDEEEFNFEEALEESLKLVHRGQRVEGVVTSIRPNEVVVDIGTKHTGFIPMDELSDDATAKPEDVVKVGDTVKLVVTKVQDLEGFVTLSKKRADSEKGLEEIARGVDEGTVFDAYITEVVNKGLVATVKGVRVFIPASQATSRRDEPFEQLVRTNQKIKILEVNLERRRAIGSIKAVLNIEDEKKREALWKEIEIGKKYTGKVKSLTTYGAFVDLGGVDGMVHKSELSWNRISKPEDVVHVGEEIEVFVKDFNPETRKISLGYRLEADNPWNAVKDCEIGSEFEAPVVSVTSFGAFVRILPGVDGLVHASEMSATHIKSPSDVVKVGDVVKARLIGVDLEKRRISLSMRPEKAEDEPIELLKSESEEEQKASIPEESAIDVKSETEEAPPEAEAQTEPEEQADPTEAEPE